MGLFRVIFGMEPKGLGLVSLRYPIRLQDWTCSMEVVPLESYTSESTIAADRSA